LQYYELYLHCSPSPEHCVAYFQAAFFIQALQKILENKIGINSSKCYKWNLVNTQDRYLKVGYENNKTFRTGNSLPRHLEKYSKII